MPSHHLGSPHARSASPKVHTAAPSSTASFTKNCPGTTEIPGNPNVASATPGVENKNDSVVKNIPAASALPTADNRAETGRAAISPAINNSATPSKAENCRTLITPYAQDISGLFATKPEIASASYAVNFIPPIHTSTITNP